MIVHIGFPKCGSTSLQRLFSQTDAIFTGCNPKAEPGAFYTPELGFFFEGAFRFGTQKQFDEQAPAIRAYFENLEKTSDRPVILSNENLAFRLTPWDLPSDIKIRRLGKLIPESSKIIIVHRPVRDLVISLYKNHLLFGYTGDFQTFLQELDILQDYGLLADLILENLCENITAAIENPEIIMLNLNAPDSLKTLLDYLKLTAKDTAQVDNPGPTSEETTTALHYNRTRPNRHQFLDWLEGHRIFPQGTMAEEDLFRVSRTRINHRESTTPPSGTIFDPNAAVWPTITAEIENQNRAFLQSTSSKKYITFLN